MPSEVCVPELAEAVVEDIVRWYVANGGASGLLRLNPVFDRGRTSYSSWGPCEQIGVVLAECPHRVWAGNSFRNDATITAIERAMIAEAEYLRLCQQVATLQTLQGELVWEQTIELQRDRDVWMRMKVRYRADPTWRPAMEWLREAFARVVFGDALRGLRGDASFLAFIVRT